MVVVVHMLTSVYYNNENDDEDYDKYAEGHVDGDLGHVRQVTRVVEKG